MFSLNLPAFDAKIAMRDGKRSIFDVVRRRYVALTPEEWVRQHLDRKSTRLNSSHWNKSRMPSSA